MICSATLASKIPLFASVTIFWPSQKMEPIKKVGYFSWLTAYFCFSKVIYFLFGIEFKGHFSTSDGLFLQCFLCKLRSFFLVLAEKCTDCICIFFFNCCAAHDYADFVFETCCFQEFVEFCDVVLCWNCVN